MVSINPGEPTLHDLLTEIKALRTLVDELVADSRKARPLLDKYMKYTSAPWARKGKS